MFEVIRPGLTTGVALVSVGAIAIAPITITPPRLAATQVVTCTDVAAQAVAVELAGFSEDMSLALSQTWNFYPVLLEALAPLLMINALINKQLASLVPITAYIATYAVTGPIEILAGPFVKNLPLPLGTNDGVIYNAVELVKAAPTLLVSLLQAPAGVLDRKLTLQEAVDAATNAIATAFTSSTEALQKIAEALGGVVPVAEPVVVTALPAAEADTAAVTLDVSPSDVGPSGGATLSNSRKAKPAMTSESEAKTVGLQQVRGSGSVVAHEKSAAPWADHTPTQKRVSASSAKELGSSPAGRSNSRVRTPAPDKSS